MTTSSKNLLVNGAAAEDGYRQATFEEVLEAARAALTNRVKKGTALTSPKLLSVNYFVRPATTIVTGAMGF